MLNTTKTYSILIALSISVLIGLSYAMKSTPQQKNSIVIIPTPQSPLVSSESPITSIKDKLLGLEPSVQTVDPILSTSQPQLQSQRGQIANSPVEVPTPDINNTNTKLSDLASSNISSLSLKELISTNTSMPAETKVALSKLATQLEAMAQQERSKGNHAPANPMEALTDIMYLYQNLDEVVENGSWNPEVRGSTNNPTSSNSNQNNTQHKSKSNTESYKKGSLADPNLTKMSIDK